MRMANNVLSVPRNCRTAIHTSVAKVNTDKGSAFMTGSKEQQ